MTFFMVIGNNGEPYEDNFTWNVRAFKTREFERQKLLHELYDIAEKRQLTEDE